MPKRNPMLARIEAAAEDRYQVRFHKSMDMLLQMGQDAAMIAAHDVLQLGPGRAEDFCIAYREAINDMARRVVDDQMDDPEFVYSKAKIDEQIRSIVGPDKFVPWEVRYGEKPLWEVRVYYRNLNGYEGARCCHYILVEHRMRARDGELCLSYRPGRGKV